jgi:tetratricopeptide (TPR) repeat protein
MTGLNITKHIMVLVILCILLSAAVTIFNHNSDQNKVFLSGRAAASPDDRPLTMKGELDIKIDMQLLFGKGGGTIVVTINGEAASELRRRIDDRYYLDLASPTRNNSRVDGALSMTSSEVGAFIELVENRLEKSPIGNSYDIFQPSSIDYDGIFSGIDITRTGGSQGVDITQVKGLTDTSISSNEKIKLTIDFGASFPDEPDPPKNTNGEIIFYALFGYLPEEAQNLNETEPDIRCYETIDARMVGMGSFSGPHVGGVSLTKYRVPGLEILNMEQNYKIGTQSGVGYILYEPLNIIQSTVVLTIFGLIMGIIMLSLPRSFLKRRSGRVKKRQWIHFMAIGFFIIIILLFLFGIDGLSIWIGAPVFTVITGIAAYKFYSVPPKASEIRRIRQGPPTVEKDLVERDLSEDNWHTIGINFFKQGNLNKALECFEKALEENVQDEVIWNDKGHVLRKLGRNNEALKCFNLALNINPDYDIARHNKQQTLLELRK